MYDELNTAMKQYLLVACYCGNIDPSAGLVIRPQLRRLLSAGRMVTRVLAWTLNSPAFMANVVTHVHCARSSRCKLRLHRFTHPNKSIAYTSGVAPITARVSVTLHCFTQAKVAITTPAGRSHCCVSGLEPTGSEKDLQGEG